MNNSGQQGPNPFVFRFKQAKPPGILGLFLILAGALFLLVFGVGILMLVATVAVILLPWLWWKRRQLLKKMASAQARYQQEQASSTSQSGVVIEGEVIKASISRDPSL